MSVNHKKQVRVNIVEQSCGKLFNKLTVLHFVEFKVTPTNRRVPLVRCQCECGKLTIASLWDVRQGKTKTCGLNHPHYEDRSLPAFNSIYNHSYKQRALAAGLEFTITKEEFRELSQRNCHYCGSAPMANSYRGSRGAFKTGNNLSQYVYNGLDRIDSNKGYVLSNVVPCCGICNHAKHTMSYDDFIAWIDRIVLFRTKKGDSPIVEGTKTTETTNTEGGTLRDVAGPGTLS